MRKNNRNGAVDFLIRAFGRCMCMSENVSVSARSHPKKQNW